MLTRFQLFESELHFLSNDLDFLQKLAQVFLLSTAAYRRFAPMAG
jgi:hypothetical protein